MGAWVWQRVARRLRAFGHEVYVPTLTGLGERAHLLTPEIDLQVHVADVVGLLSYEDLQDVVLVGHSYGGMVISGVYPAVEARVASLVYFDALIPQTGECAYDLMTADTAQRLRQATAENGNGWRVPAHAAHTPMPERTSTDDLHWMRSRLTDQPSRTYEQPFQAARDVTPPPCSFVHCTAPSTIPDHTIERANQRPHWHYRQLNVPHLAPLTHPDATADALLTAP